MSIDFDSAALQTQHDEEEYDQEDFAREQELHKLLTDLPDDMLEDSRDSSSPELESSTYSRKNTGNSPQPKWNQDWSDHVQPTSHAQASEVGSHDEYVYEDGPGYPNGHLSHPPNPLLPHGWNRDHHFVQENQTRTNMDSDDYAETGDYPAECEPMLYPESTKNHVDYNGDGGYSNHHGDHGSRSHFQLQTANREQVAQLQVLNKGQQRQIEDLERKLEDSRRNMRYIEHQFAIVKDEKDGLAVSLKESSRLIEEAKKGEVQMQNKLKVLEQQVQILREKDQENTKRLKVADAAVDSMKQQMLELCRSDTLSRTREQHDRDLATMKEQHQAALLALEQKLDSTSQAFNDQIDVSKKLQQQVKQLERQREEEQLERARIVNSLTQRLEESQQQCAKLLQTSHSVLNHLSESKLPKEEALRLLRMEMQRCLGCLKAKRQKINQLQDELQQSQARVRELLAELEEAKLSSTAKETDPMTHLDMTEGAQEEMLRMQEEKQHLLEKVQLLETKNKELKQNEEKLKCANSELCTKMREMIQELDQEKQEAAERTERINQQYRDDVVKRVRTELMTEHSAELERLTAQHQQQIQELQNQLSEVSDKMLAVQECYISVCNEKCLLEETIKKREKEESSRTAGKLRGELEAQHQVSVMKLKEEWSKEKEAEIQREVSSHVASTDAKWKKELQKIETTWAQKLEEAKRERNSDTAEAMCQTEELEANGHAVSAEELDARLAAQKQEADKEQHKAVEEAKKRIQRELEEKHLNDMAKQVEGAVTRAYSRWIEDLPSLPEHQTLLQREKQKWEELQEEVTRQKVSQALREAEEERHKKQVEHPQEELAALKSQLEQASREQAALLKAELAAARAAWHRDKQQEISIIQAQNQQAYQTKLLEQCKNLEQAVQGVREDADLQRKELLLQMEAKLQQALRTREEEWRRQYAEKELAQRQQTKEQFLSELQAAVADVSTQLLRPSGAELQQSEDGRSSSRSPSQAAITNIIETACREMVKRAVLEAKKEWKKTSEEKLSNILKETQERHTREVHKIQDSLSQRKERSCYMKECTESLGKLQKKNQELQRHLEKACRQLQHRIREHKTAIQVLKGMHFVFNTRLKASASHNITTEDLMVRSSQWEANLFLSVFVYVVFFSNRNSDLQQALEEMKQQYLITVEKIRGDMLRYLQESRGRAAEMIRIEVQRERQDTARKMRHYYLTCLQELLEDGGKTTGAEKKIMSAASKLAAMAKVLETPVKSKSGKNYVLQSCQTGGSSNAAGGLPAGGAGFSTNLAALNKLPDLRPEQQPVNASVDPGLKPNAAAGSKLLIHQDTSAPQEGSDAAGSKPQTFNTIPPSYKSQQTSSQQHMDFVASSSTGKISDWLLQGGDSNKAVSRAKSAGHSRPFLVQEAPVRDEKQADWSLASSDSDSGPNVARTSHHRRRVEPLRPLTVSEMGAFGGLTPDGSDLTVYQEIPKQTPMTEKDAQAKRSLVREPIPGSECENWQQAHFRVLFGELRERQQDSGFDSPTYQQK
ncbi:PREDICTED: centrosomal protein of 152 kDa [Cyprinodon variegatus]|uniref:centrosomal protein of 152 kDa n=1 Tax=Cyprinodon variegatus TaxID=28743 RepID=UPI00074264EC|nr:PREDICTED: centrosomal protein of 152 kDa [Cyprinodon variegatus]